MGKQTHKQQTRKKYSACGEHVLLQQLFKDIYTVHNLNKGQEAERTEIREASQITLNGQLSGSWTAGKRLSPLTGKMRSELKLCHGK